MIIDSCTYIGHWPFRKLICETLDEVASLAEKNGITHILTSNLNAIFYIDPMEGNRELIEQCRAYTGKVTVLPFAVIDPTYIEWERDLRECADMGFKGIQLVPQYHGYSPERAAPLYRLCARLGLAVKIDTGFENIRQRAKNDVHFDLTPDEIAALIETCDDVTTVVSMLQTMSLGRLGEIINARDNVFANIVYLDSFTNGQLEAGLKDYTSKKLCFGTQSPFRYAEPQFVKLFASDGIGVALDDNARENILATNLTAKLL